MGLQTAQNQSRMAIADGTQTTEFLHLNNPKNYKFLPANFT